MSFNKKVLEKISAVAVVFSVPLIVVLGQVFGIQKFVTLGFIPFLFFLSLAVNSFSIRYPIVVKLYLLFFLFCSFSFISAKYLDVYVDEVKTLLGSCIFGLSLYNFIHYKSIFIRYSLASYFLSSVLFAAYLYYLGLFDLSLIFEPKFRIEDDIFNANMLNYYVFLSTFALFIFLSAYESSTLFYLYIGSIIFFLLITFISGSRAGLAVFLLINFLYLAFIKFNKSLNYARQSVLLTVAIIVAYTSLEAAFSYIIQETNIGFRFSVFFEEGEETERALLLKEALSIYSHNPILGVGAGNFVAVNRYRLFSHNNYSEILVNFGTFTFLIYVLTFGVLIKQSISYYKGSSIYWKKIFAVIILYFFSFAIYSNFYPFYKVIPFTGFLFLISATIEKRKLPVYYNKLTI